LRLDPGADPAPELQVPQVAVDLPQIALPPLQAALPDAEPDETAPPPVRRSVRFGDLAEEYAATFKAARLLPGRKQSTDWHLTMMRQSRSRYEAVGKRNGVPWYFIAAIHALEGSFNFRGHLHNGDAPLAQRTRQVPAGRPLVWGPPSDWESSATDALRLMGFAGASDWGLARTLYRLEAYNGFGYRRIGKVSPYLWSFSSVYNRGKFVADGRYNPNARSSQCGAAVMLKLLSDAGDIELA
jgi:lysozyme family protein